MCSKHIVKTKADETRMLRRWSLGRIKRIFIDGSLGVTVRNRKNDREYEVETVLIHVSGEMAKRLLEDG